MEQSDIAIRPARQADASSIAACVRSAYEHYVAMIGIAPNPMLDDYSVVIERSQVSVLTLVDDIVGVLVLEVTDEGFLLNNVAVDPLHQGKGLGSLLLQFAENEAKRQGHKSIYLYTNVKMTENLAIYAERGFQEYDRREVNGRHGVFMRKTIDDVGAAPRR